MVSSEEKKNKTLEKIMVAVLLIVVASFVIIMLVYGVPQMVNLYPLEKAAKNYVKTLDYNTTQFCCAQQIDENRGVGFINYDCVRPKILKGLAKCKGRYAILVDKIGGKWVVNESSKRVIW